MVPHKEVNNLEEPQDPNSVLVEEKVAHLPHYLLETSVSKQQLMDSSHFSLSVVTLRMLESL